jgi:hypothetical protein
MTQPTIFDIIVAGVPEARFGAFDSYSTPTDDWPNILEWVSPLGGAVQVEWSDPTVDGRGRPVPPSFEVAYREWDRTHGMKTEVIIGETEIPGAAAALVCYILDEHNTIATQAENEIRGAGL